MRKLLARLDPATVVMVAVCLVALSSMLSALLYLRLDALQSDSRQRGVENHCLLARVAYYTGDGAGARQGTENFNRYLRGEIKSLPEPVPFPKGLCK